jgi:hypothetical protein
MIGYTIGIYKRQCFALFIGFSLSKVIARNRVETWLDCGQRCIGERSCVGFNFNERLMNRHNCELTDEFELSSSGELNKDSSWKYYQGIFEVSIF